MQKAKLSAVLNTYLHIQKYKNGLSRRITIKMEESWSVEDWSGRVVK